eukprot:Blabericola_migrator_1__9925@NODE_548_length_7679_cov_28_102207_g414_i0_p6_GENE_NODE_548_length_7679_cov_28_102207_g414_i0NODE_548_length_7679_cov_28_102207_g414_i0_p6_ORF_typecomplete_len138_score11_58OSTHTH/PF12872_7/2_3e07OSTHTH/PF12872_7/4_1e03HTH_32/PF13565_6/2_7HTH_32/PF13565_6/1_3e02_NODE_548_length_7679_cov_28_102207_g414_i068087221
MVQQMKGGTSLPDKVVQRIYELLTIKPSYSASELRPAYKDRFGEDLNYRELGFNEISDLMRLVPHTIVGRGPNGLEIRKDRYKTPKPRRVRAAYPKLNLDREGQISKLSQLEWADKLVVFEEITPWCSVCELVVCVV